MAKKIVEGGGGWRACPELRIGAISRRGFSKTFSATRESKSEDYSGRRFHRGRGNCRAVHRERREFCRRSDSEPGGRAAVQSAQIVPPGCGSASEISQAEELGVEIVKVFPGYSVGGRIRQSDPGPTPWTRCHRRVETTKESINVWFKARHHRRRASARPGSTRSPRGITKPSPRRRKKCGMDGRRGAKRRSRSSGTPWPKR